MKFVLWTTCVLALSVAAAVSADAKPIKKQKDFMATIVGKKLVSGNSWIVASADGKLTGVSRKGEKITGAWIWHKRFFCRNIYLGQTRLPEDCNTVSIDGNTATFTRDKGKGKATIFSF